MTPYYTKPSLTCRYHLGDNYKLITVYVLFHEAAKCDAVTLILRMKYLVENRYTVRAVRQLRNTTREQHNLQSIGAAASLFLRSQWDFSEYVPNRRTEWQSWRTTTVL